MTYVPTEKGIKFVDQIVDVVVECVAACGDDGVPGGHLYASLMGPPLSLNLESFEMLMLIAVRQGKLVKRGQCYFTTKEKGK